MEATEIPQCTLLVATHEATPLDESRVDTSTHKRCVDGPPRKVRLDDEKKVSDRAGQRHRVRPASLESSHRLRPGSTLTKAALLVMALFSSAPNARGETACTKILRPLVVQVGFP